MTCLESILSWFEFNEHSASIPTSLIACWLLLVIPPIKGLFPWLQTAPLSGLCDTGLMSQTSVFHIATQPSRTKSRIIVFP